MYVIPDESIYECVALTATYYFVLLLSDGASPPSMNCCSSSGRGSCCERYAFAAGQRSLRVEYCRTKFSTFRSRTKACRFSCQVRASVVSPTQSPPVGAPIETTGRVRRTLSEWMCSIASKYRSATRLSPAIVSSRPRMSSGRFQDSTVTLEIYRCWTVRRLMACLEELHLLAGFMSSFSWLQNALP